MTKSKFLMMGRMAVLLLTFALVLTACGDDSSGDNTGGGGQGEQPAGDSVMNEASSLGTNFQIRSSGTLMASEKSAIRANIVSAVAEPYKGWLGRNGGLNIFVENGGAITGNGLHLTLSEAQSSTSISAKLTAYLNTNGPANETPGANRCIVRNYSSASPIATLIGRVSSGYGTYAPSDDKGYVTIYIEDAGSVPTFSASDRIFHFPLSWLSGAGAGGIASFINLHSGSLITSLQKSKVNLQMVLKGEVIARFSSSREAWDKYLRNVATRQGVQRMG